jgi:adenylate kinase
LPLKCGFTGRSVSDFPSNPFPLSISRSSKLLVLGHEANFPKIWSDHFRSLHIEHVSPGTLVSQEICRRSPLGQSAELAQQRGTPVPVEIITALMRRWFMARKPDAGFALTGFPATLLQARILDEWLDARDESLDGVYSLCPTDSAGEIVNYYRIHGLFVETENSGDFAFRP